VWGWRWRVSTVNSRCALLFPRGRSGAWGRLAAVIENTFRHENTDQHVFETESHRFVWLPHPKSLPLHSLSTTLCARKVRPVTQLRLRYRKVRALLRYVTLLRHNRQAPACCLPLSSRGSPTHPWWWSSAAHAVDTFWTGEYWLGALGRGTRNTPNATSRQGGGGCSGQRAC
jgi:hypothetical protein